VSKTLIPLFLLALGLFPGASAAQELVLEKGEFDASAWHELVGRFAGETGVDYNAWKDHGTEDLDAFLAAAADFDVFSIMGKEPKGAFFLNLYNAWAVRQILEHYPVESVRDIDGFFDSNGTRFGDKEVTLEGIEGLLGKYMSTMPSILLCTAPGTKGRAPLPSLAYSAGTLAPAGAAVAAASATAGGIRFDNDASVLHMPAYLEKNIAVLESHRNGLAGFLAQFITLSEVMALTSGDYTIIYHQADGALNMAAPAADEEN